MKKLPFIKRGYTANMRFSQPYSYSSKTTLGILIGLITIVFTILSFRLFQLTIVKGAYYRRLAEQNRIRELIIEPKRGTIVDRKGIVIAHNAQSDLSTINDRLTSKRTYDSTSAIGPVIGYRQLADASDLKNDPCMYKLKLGDRVGKKGVEKLYECELRGQQGKKLIEIDAHGKYLRTLSILPPVDGKTMKLSLDLDLQKKAYDLVKDKKAAIIGLKPQTGEILVLVSTPSYNSQDFEDRNAEMVKSLLKDDKKPLFNRVTEGNYAPGSVFKLTVAVGALEEKKITAKTVIEDTGIIKAGPLTFGNWYFLQYGKTEGSVDVVKAIRRSNDTFFYKTGELLGPEKIKYWAETFGYGKKTGIGFEESEGVIPSPFWKEEILKEQWYLGDTYNLSIGQGYALVTPLQVAQTTAAIAGNGSLCKPKILKEDKPSCQTIKLDRQTLALIQNGMREACSTGGTGWPFFDFKIKSGNGVDRPFPVACKTGTAEGAGKTTVPHAWFTIYAPYDKPEIALTVLVEEGGQGSDVAAPIAKEILKAYFERSQ